MAIQISELKRVFLFSSARLPDPDPTLSVEEVRDMYTSSYPELATATIEPPKTADGELQYTFTRAVGAKG